MPYEVSTPVFEGPFDLLLHLITREQIDIYEINVATIVDAYLAEIAKFEALDLEIATEFLLIAATLIELKIRRMLPDREGIELDEELGLLEERDLLLAKLLECQTFKQAAHMLQQLAAEASRSIPRLVGPGAEFAELVPDPLAGVSPEKLRAAYLAVMTRSLTPKPVPRVSLDHVTPVRLSVAEAVGELAQVLTRGETMTFREITSDLTDQVEIIVYFLAVLELYKQGWVELEQPETFGALTIAWRPEGPPSAALVTPFDEADDGLDHDGRSDDDLLELDADGHLDQGDLDDRALDAELDLIHVPVPAVSLEVDDYDG